MKTVLCLDPQHYRHAICAEGAIWLRRCLAIFYDMFLHWYFSVLDSRHAMHAEGYVALALCIPIIPGNGNDNDDNNDNDNKMTTITIITLITIKLPK